jgi:hypothetical protein
LIIVPEEYYAQTPELDNYFEVSDDRAWADYVYELDSLVKLSGKKLAKKRTLFLNLSGLS